MNKLCEDYRNFDVRSQRCKGCPGWGDCAMHNMDQFTPPKSKGVRK